MNQATQWRIAFARQMAAIYAENPKVSAIVISGSVSRGQADGYSDIELDLFWQEPPTEAERIRPIEQVNGRIIMIEPYADDEWSEDYTVNGVQMDMSSFLVATLDRYIAEVLAGDTAVLKHLRLAAMQQATPLHGQAQIEKWQSQIRYPDALAEKVVGQNLRFEALGIWYLRGVLLARGDWLMLHDVFCRMQQRILGALCGLNHIFVHHPNYKWQADLITQMSHKPAHLAERLQQVFLVSPAEGITILHELLQDTIALAASHLPHLDFSRSTEAIRWQRQPITEAPPIPDEIVGGI
jgi:hypothetical protein